MDIKKFNNLSHEFNLVNNNRKIVCFHYYGKHRKNTIKIACELPSVIDDKVIKKAIKELKKAIKEEKKYLTPLHGCTDYLNTIKI